MKPKRPKPVNEKFKQIQKRRKRALARIKKMRERSARALKIVAERTTEPTEDAVKSAVAVLKKVVPNDESGSLPQDYLSALVEQKMAHKLVVTSRTKYLQCLQIVYAAYVEIGARGDVQNDLAVLAERKGIKLTKSSDPLTVILRALIDYGTTDDGTPDQTKRRAWSRDAAAIHWLEQEKIKPADVLHYQERSGGGLDEWSRDWARFKSGKKAPQLGNETVSNIAGKREQAPAEQEPDKSQLSIEQKLLNKIQTDNDGAVILVRRRNNRIFLMHTRLVSNLTTKARRDKIWKKAKAGFASKKASEDAPEQYDAW